MIGNNSSLDISREENLTKKYQEGYRCVYSGIYFITDSRKYPLPTGGDAPVFKIGLSENVEQRIHTLARTQSFIEDRMVVYKIIGTTDIHNCYETEKWFHNYFAEKRVSSGKEWFFIIPEEIDRACQAFLKENNNQQEIPYIKQVNRTLKDTDVLIVTGKKPLKKQTKKHSKERYKHISKLITDSGNMTIKDLLDLKLRFDSSSDKIYNKTSLKYDLKLGYYAIKQTY